MAAFDGLRNWAKDRPRLAAAAGGGLVALLALVLVIGRGGGDVAPTVGGTVEPAVAGNTPAADGTVVAQPGTQPVPGQPATDPGAAPAASTDTVGPPATTTEVSSAQATESSMNTGLPKAPPALDGAGTSPVSTPLQSTDDVAFAGRKLEHVADELDACLAAGKEDIFACLKVVPDGYTTVRIYEDRPQGAQLTIDGTNVGIKIRDGVRCRTLGTSPDCNAWSAVDG